MSNQLPWNRPHDIGTPEPAVNVADEVCRNCDAPATTDNGRCEACEGIAYHEHQDEKRLEAP